MADTGAPWNIPFVEPTDLVRDYPAADEAQALAVAAGLSAAGNAGIGSNVVQTVKTDTFSTTSQSLTEITGLAVTITPSDSSSKILLLLSLAATNTEVGRSIRLDITGGNAAAYLGPAEGSRPGSIIGVAAYDGRGTHSISGVYLDSADTTSAVTYQVRIARTAPAGAAVVNRTSSDSDDEQNPRAVSTLTAIEVAA